MLEEEKLQRRAEALRAIYCARGEELSEIESRAMADQLGNKPARAAIVCLVVIVALMAFLVWRFLF